MPIRGRPITLADLATHSSGLPRLPKGWLVGAQENSERAVDRIALELLKALEA
jgi:CubicO group peptidase (beta-lactamase class C family)